MKRIYISGKIGEDIISDGTREKFKRAEETMGRHFNPEFYQFINPVSEAFQESMDVDFQWRQIPKNLPDILLYDLQWLRTCDVIYMLEDWKQSDGANLELDYARCTGMRILWQDEEDAKVFCDNPERYESVWIPIAPNDEL